MLDRNFAMNLRTGKRKITEEEKIFILKEIDRIEADSNAFVFDETGGDRTHYSQKRDKIIIGSNVFPDAIYSNSIIDKLSVACVLAHEYYGHRAMRDIYLNEKVVSAETPLDEFNASFRAFKNTPNLTIEEREMLLVHAMSIAIEGDLVEERKMCREMIRQFYYNENN